MVSAGAKVRVRVKVRDRIKGFRVGVRVEYNCANEVYIGLGFWLRSACHSEMVQTRIEGNRGTKGAGSCVFVVWMGKKEMKIEHE